MKIAIILSLFLFGGGLRVVVGQDFASEQLEKLAKEIGLSAPTKDGVHYQATQYKGLPVTVIVKDGEVRHIGHALFTPFQRQFIDETQCNFLERISLAADIPDFYGIAIRQYLRDEKVEFLDGQLDYLKTILNDTTYIFQSTLVDGKTYIACWYTPSGNQRYLTLAYPANFHLITGLAMTEAENRLFGDIRRTQIEETEQFVPAEALMQCIGNGPVHLLKGSIFFLPELNSNRYYVKEGNGLFSLLYSEDYPLETLANLMTGIEIENQFVINVKLVKYGYQVDDFNIPLTNWLAFCIQSGCSPYFGIISQEENKIVGELIMQNEALAYCHVMKLTIDPSLLKERKGTFQARLNSYVPMSNVKALFNESK
jgi:hypothetical protein